MGLLDRIEELREKPVAERKRWAFIVALSVTAAVAVIWLSFLAFRFASAPAAERENRAGAATTTPFETIREAVGDAWGSVDRAFRAFGTVDYVPPTRSASSSESELR